MIIKILYIRTLYEAAKLAHRSKSGTSNVYTRKEEPEI